MKPRCPHCGGAYAAWTRDMLIEAAQRWAEKHGRAPSPNDWADSNAEHPNKSAPYRVFGSWPNFIEAAGLTPVKGRRWTREECLHHLLVFRFENGRLPYSREWMLTSPDRPNVHRIRMLFGSWGAFIVAAGYEPNVKRRTEESYRKQAGAAARVRDERGRLVAA